MLDKVFRHFHRQGEDKGRIRALPLSAKAAPLLYEVSCKILLEKNKFIIPSPLPPPEKLYHFVKSPIIHLVIKSKMAWHLSTIYLHIQAVARPIKFAYLTFFKSIIPPATILFQVSGGTHRFQIWAIDNFLILCKVLFKGSFKQPLPKIPSTVLNRHSGVVLQVFPVWLAITRFFFFGMLTLRYQCNILEEMPINGWTQQR